MHKIKKLLEIPQFEQRSDEWFKQRENKLTSSDAATVLGINPYQKAKEVLFKKCGKDLNPFVGNVATRHGQKYEDEAIDKYCELTNTKNYNFGLISYEDVYKDNEYYWLAGSPDGIAINKDDENSDPILLEVKCPYKRKIVMGEIPKYYVPQVQLNMFICDLDVADFIEYCPTNNILNIVRLERDDIWLSENIPILEEFWKTVEYYRKDDITKHPEFPKEKKILNLRKQESEDLKSIYMIKE